MIGVPSDSGTKCPLSSALGMIGDRWTLLILFCSLFGTAHFEDFLSHLGIARNILSNRLARLVKLGVLTRHVMESDKRRVEYRLTQKGLDIAPMLMALRQWTAHWEEGGALMANMADKRDRLPIRELGLYAQDGRLLAPDDIVWLNDRGEEVSHYCSISGSGDDAA
jgi:DNA-binding HxlR family transcriptional regulator